MILRLVKRIATYLLVLLGLSMLIFVISRVAPGDPARLALGSYATEEAVEKLRQEMHLEEPLSVQYLYRLKGAVRLDFGNSTLSKRAVFKDIKQYLPATLEIVFISATAMIIIGITLGVLATKYSGTWLDGVVRIISYLGVCAPAIVWAIILMLMFSYVLPVFPATGRIGVNVLSPPTVTGLYTIDYLLNGDLYGYKDAVKHLILPSFGLIFGGIAQSARITRSTMSENSTKDYILAQQAYGIPEGRILTKYLLKASMIPTVSVTSLDIANIFGIAFLVEQLFNYPGLARYGMLAIMNKDLNAIAGCVMMLGVVFIIVNIFIDFIVSILDPRVRLMGGDN